MKLRIYQTIPQTRVLGPFTRFALWVQGCPMRCKGCMTPDALSFEGGDEIDVETLAAKIVATPKIEGITISGGEPFVQANELNRLLHIIQQEKQLGVIIYSGYQLTQLQRMAKQEKAIQLLLEHCDLLIDSPYQAQHNDGKALRGSANQHIHLLSPRYANSGQNHYANTQRAVEAHVQKDGVMLVGIPGQATLQHWEQWTKGVKPL